MKHTTIKLAICAAVLSALPVFAEDDNVCYWIGGTVFENYHAQWGNSANWKDGKIPGLYRVKQGDVWVTNGSRNCTAVFGKCSNDKCRNIRVQDTSSWELISVSNMVFQGSDCSAYNFSYGTTWSWQWGGRTPKIEAGGKVFVDAAVPTAPVFDGIEFGVGAKSTVTCYVENNSKTPLVIHDITDIPASDVAAGWKGVIIQFEGTGGVQIDKVGWSGASHYVPIFSLAMTGGKLFVKEGDISYLYSLRTVDGFGRQCVDVASGHYLRVMSSSINDGYFPFEVREDLLVTGEGELRVTSVEGQNHKIMVSPGKKLEIACTLDNKLSGTFKEEAAGGFRLFNWDVGGVCQISGVNNIPGAIELRSTQLDVEAATQFGKGQRIWLSNRGKVRYTGVGEISDKVIRLESEGSIEQAGSGDLIFASADSTSDSAVLKLSSVAGAAVGFAGDVSAKLSLTDGSTLALKKPSASDALTVSSLTVAGATTVAVGDGVTATVSSLTRTGAATVNVVTTGSGAVKFTQLAAGLAPTWLTVNGHGGLVKADGSVVDRDAAADDTSIDAHGGVVPNAAGQTVGIATATGPAGQNVTLAADATEVLMLRQRQAVDPATVEIGAAQTLSVGAITVETGAKPLTLGTVVGQGAVAPSGDSLEFDVKDADGKITANAAVTIPSDKTFVKSGAGEVELAGGFSGAAEIKDGTMTIDGAGDAVAELTGPGAFTASGSPAENLALDVTDGTVSLSGKIADSALTVGASSTARLVIDGGEIEGALTVASGEGSRAAVHLKSGAFTWKGYNTSAKGVRSFKMSGGTLTSDKAISLANGNYEVFELAGGTFEDTYVHSTWGYTMQIGGNWDCGALRISGGTMKLKGLAIPAITDSGRGVVTIDGPTAELAVPTILMGMLFPSGTQYSNEQLLNINAGKLTGATVGSWQTYHSSAQLRYVNFNGGTFRYEDTGYPFGKTGEWIAPVDRITVFRNGMTFETDRTAKWFAVPISAPIGKGLKSVKWTTPVSGLAGSMVVSISGDGHGASAFAEVNEQGELADVVVTSPGWGYTQMTASLIDRPAGGTTKTLATFECELEDQVSGGFTKTGTGSVGFGAANTYTGPTVVKGGALKLVDGGSINPQSSLVLDGGDFDMNGKEQTFAGFDCRSGKVLNGTLAVSALTVDFNRVLADDAPTFNSAYAGFTSGAQFTLVNYDATKLDPSKSYWVCKFVGGRPANLPAVSIDVPEGHRLSVSDAGIRISRDIGMAVIIR